MPHDLIYTNHTVLDPDWDSLEISAPPDNTFWRKRGLKARRSAINKRYYVKHQAKVGSRALRKAIDESEAEELAACGDFPKHEEGK